MKVIQKGDALTFISNEELVSVGINLNSQTGIRFAAGDAQKWKENGKREWTKYTFGCYGCWVIGDDGFLDYVPEEEHTDKLWNKQKKSAERNTAVHQRNNHLKIT